MKEPVLVVMAAGLGSRFGGLKQMEAITNAGEIILDYSVYDAWRAGFNEVIFIIKEEMEKDFIKKVIIPMRKYLKVRYVFQNINALPEGYSVPADRIKPWGTCHAVMACREFVDSSFAVINADDYYGRDAFVKVRNFLMSDSPDNAYCMAGYYIQNTLSEKGTVTRGVCRTDEEDNLIGIEEIENIGWQLDGSIAAVNAKTRTIEKGTIVSMNFWGFRLSMMDKIVNDFPEFLNKELRKNRNSAEYLLPIEVGKLLENREISVKVLKVNDRWYGVTYQEDKEKVRDAFEKMKNERKYPAKLWK